MFTIIINGLLLLVACSYSIFIFYVIRSWNKLEEFDLEPEGLSKTLVSVILPIHNEEKNVKWFMDSYYRSHNEHEYSELLISDDHSTDKSTVHVMEKLNKGDRLISADGSERRGKKYAIDHAIEQSNGQIIITSDADCTIPDNWIDLHILHIENQALTASCGPVFIDSCNSLVEWWQHFDQMATMMVSQVGMHEDWFYSASAANLAYLKSFYERNKPFSDNYHIPSGDDIFLLEKLKACGAKIGFLKNRQFFVRTQAVKNWKELFKQRKRWAYKTRFYENNRLKIFWGSMVFLLFSYCLSPFLLLCCLDFYLFSFIWTIKYLTDLILLRKMANYYALEFDLLQFTTSFLFYPFVTLAIALSAIFKSVNTGQ